MGPGGATGGQPAYGSSRVDAYFKLFEEKVTEKQEFKYNGKEHGMTWRNEVKNYLIGRCPDCLYLLEAAERTGKNVIEPRSFIGFVMQLYPGVRLELDLAVVSGHRWTFLGLCLGGEAKSVHNSGDAGRLRNGFEACARTMT